MSILPPPKSREDLLILQEKRKKIAFKNAKKSKYFKGKLDHIDIERLEESEAVDATPQAVAANYWVTIAAVLGILLFFTSWKWMATRSKLGAALKADPLVTRPTFDSPGEDQAFKVLTTACKSNNAKGAHQHLFLWEKRDIH